MKIFKESPIFYISYRNCFEKISIAIFLLLVTNLYFLALPTQQFAAGQNCAQPPDFEKLNIDPMNLSNNEIVTYGLPHKPTDQQKLEKWKEVVKHAKHRVCPSDVPAPDPIHKIFQINYTNDPKWSGWAAFPDTSFGLHEATASWYAPCITSGMNSPYSISSHWVGLGGTNTQLLQAGTVSNDVNYQPVYKAFVENTGPLQSQQEQDVFTIANCGDLIFADIYLPNWVWIGDEISGVYYGTVQDGSVSGGNNSWECISEWQGYYSSYFASAFGSVSFSGCDGYDSNGIVKTIAQTNNPASIVSKDPNNRCVLGTSHSLTNGDSFYTKWFNYN